MGILVEFVFDFSFMKGSRFINYLNQIAFCKKETTIVSGNLFSYMTFYKKETTMVSQKYSWFHVIYLRIGHSAKGNQSRKHLYFPVIYLRTGLSAKRNQTGFQEFPVIYLLTEHSANKKLN